MEVKELNQELFQKISLKDKEEIKSILKDYNNKKDNLISI